MQTRQVRDEKKLAVNCDIRLLINSLRVRRLGVECRVSSDEPSIRVGENGRLNAPCRSNARVLHVSLIFPRVYIQHNQCPSRFLREREASSVLANCKTRDKQCACSSRFTDLSTRLHPAQPVSESIPQRERETSSVLTICKTRDTRR